MDNIINFHFKESVYDLALRTSLKVILLYLILWKMESIAMAQIDTPFRHNLFKHQKVLHVCYSGLCFVGLAYTATKGGFILDAILNNQKYEKMHLSYNILIIMTCLTTRDSK